jgi:predicted nucleotidyltransferase
MLKLCRVDLERSEEIYKKIDVYRDAVAEKLNPEKIILFGSFARGDYNECSDIDILVIRHWKEDFLERIKVLLDLNENGLPLEPIGYTNEEFNSMRTEGNTFIADVILNGRVIYSMDCTPVTRQK